MGVLEPLPTKPLRTCPCCETLMMPLTDGDGDVLTTRMHISPLSESNRVVIGGPSLLLGLWGCPACDLVLTFALDRLVVRGQEDSS